jgi:hypothetical protein
MMTTTGHQISEVVTFPTSQPDGEVVARLERGQRLADVPTWSIQTLQAGPSRSSPEYNQHLRDTVGSSYDWSDELRFDKRTGRLKSFVLKTPEAGMVDPVTAGSWLALSRQKGLPLLEDRENGFHINPLDLRYLSEDGRALVSADAKLPVADGGSLRLAISDDVDLLFHRGRYGGWILGAPIVHLVAEPGHKTAGSDEPRLHELLREYLTLVVEPYIARMSDEDPEMQKALQALRARIQQIDGVQARALLSAIDRVLDVFYPE